MLCFGRRGDRRGRRASYATPRGSPTVAAARDRPCRYGARSTVHVLRIAGGRPGSSSPPRADHARRSACIEARDHFRNEERAGPGVRARPCRSFSATAKGSARTRSRSTPRCLARGRCWSARPVRRPSSSEVAIDARPGTSVGGAGGARPPTPWAGARAADDGCIEWNAQLWLVVCSERTDDAAPQPAAVGAVVRRHEREPNSMPGTCPGGRWSAGSSGARFSLAYVD
jgi:hypothetical protein